MPSKRMFPPIMPCNNNPHDICLDAVWSHYDYVDEDRADKFKTAIDYINRTVGEDLKEYEAGKDNEAFITWRALRAWEELEDINSPALINVLYFLQCDIVETLEELLEQQLELDREANEEYHERQEEYRRMVSGN